MPKRNILLAMFDVRPKRESGGFDFGKIETKIDLRKQITDFQTNPVGQGAGGFKQHGSIFGHRKTEGLATTGSRPAAATYFVPKIEINEDLFLKLPKPSSKKYILEELEKTLAESASPIADLTSYGGQIYEGRKSVSRPKVMPARRITRPMLVDSEIEALWEKATHEDHDSGEIAVAVESGKIEEPILQFAMLQDPASSEMSVQAGADEETIHSPASREIEVWLENIKKNRQALSSPYPSKQSHKPTGQIFARIKPKWFSRFRFNRKAMMWFLGLAMSGALVFGLARDSTIGIKNNVAYNGDSAVANLENAKQKLESFDFLNAADSFALAYDDFNKASGTLNQLGDSFISLFGNLPGLGKLKAANNLIEAGQNLSKAGENLSLAFGTIYKTNWFSFLDNGGTGQSAGQGSVAGLIKDFKDVLVFADRNIKKANGLLADIDVSLIPDDKRQLFLNFKDKVPEFQKYIGDAIDYSDFLLRFVGDKGAKTYLVLLQNNSELRPTGGFPGTYALITFDKGYLKKIFVDDIYQLDAGIKENIEPPIPLQHITLNWGLRDANWFADFPASAQKIEDFYKLDGGGELDGVLTVTPDIIAKILKVIGPIDMPDYGLKLDSANFLDQIQEEVEYKADRARPKKILSDLQPKFFEKLSQQDKDHWLEIFKILLDSARGKHILAYFNDTNLENIAVKNGLGGEIKQPTGGDYLQIAIANVKGSKTDFVTDTSFNLEAAMNESGAIEHTLAINRIHNGGDSKYGFYNKTNPAYIKVYVPAGSVLESVKGQSITDYKSLTAQAGFELKKDADLERIESGISKPFAGIDVFEESNRTVFGFWLVTKPKETKTVVLKYKTAAEAVDGRYSLLWQKQSGTDGVQIKFSFKLPDGKLAADLSEGLQLVGGNLISNSDLAEDRAIDIKLR